MLSKLRLSKLRRWLSPPTFPDDEQTRIAKLLNAMLLALVGLIVLDAVLLLFFAPETIPTFWINGVIALGGGFLLWMMHRGQVRFAGLLLCVLLWPLAIYYLAISGGLNSPSITFLCGFVAIGGTLFGARGAIAFGLLDVVAALAFYFAGNSGLLTSVEGTPTLSRLFVTNSVSFLLLALLVAISGRSVHEAMMRARRGENALANQNKELQRQITERKHADDLLRQSEERYRLIAENATDMIGSYTPEGVCTYVSPVCRALLGYEPEDLVGRSSYDFFYPDDVPAIGRSHTTVLETSQAASISYRIRRKDGTYTWFESTSRTVRDPETDAVQQIVSVSRDISERKMAEERLRRSEERYRFISDIITDYAFCNRVEPDQSVVTEWETDSLTRMTGYTPSEQLEIQDQRHYKLFHPDEQARAALDMEKILKGQMVDNDYRIVTKEGEIRWIHLYRRPVWDEAQNRVVRYYGVAQDTTERKKAEDLLRKAEFHYRTIADFTYAMEYWQSMDNSVQYMSPSCERITGYTPAEFAQRPALLRELILPEDSATFNQHSREALETPGVHSVRFRIRRRDGEVRWIDHICQPIIDEQGNNLGFRASNNDITERTRAEQELQRRDIILEAISVASGRFLTAPDWQQEIIHVLGILGQADEVDRAAIFQLDWDNKDRPMASMIYEWDAPGIAIQFDNPLVQKIDIFDAGYGPLIERLKQKLPGIILARTFQPDKRAIIDSLGVLSAVHLPVFLQGKLWGTLYFSTTHDERDWSKPELEALQVAADMLGTVIERRQSDEALNQYMTRLKILHQIDRAILTAVSPQEIAQAALRHIRQLIPCQHTTIEIFDLATNERMRLAADINGSQGNESGMRRPVDVRWLDAIRHGQALSIPDLHSVPEPLPTFENLRNRGYRSIASIPLMIREELFGSLTCLANEAGVFTADHIEIAREVADQVTIAIQQARLFETEREQRALAEALRDTAAALTSSLDPNVVMARILENAGRFVQHSAANIMLIEGDAAQIVYWHGYTDERPVTREGLTLDIPSLRRMIDTRQPVFIADIAAHQEWVEWSERPWMRSYAGAPLLVRGIVIGFLNLDSALPRVFSALHAEHLQAFANQAAVAIENSRLYDQLRRHAVELEQRVNERTRDLQVVSEVSRQITTVLDIDKLLSELVERVLKEFSLYHVAVFLSDESGRTLRYKAGTTLTDRFQEGDRDGETIEVTTQIFPSVVPRAALTREPIWLSDVTGAIGYDADPDLPGTRSELALPMLVGQRLVGVLDLRSEQADRFTPDSVRILTNLAEQIGVAVGNAQLFAEVEQTRRESEILYRVSRAVNATTSYPALMQALVDELGPIDYNIGLGIYENFSFKDARYTDMVAMVVAGQTEVTAVNQRFPIYILKADDAGVSVLEDVDDRSQVDETGALYFNQLGIKALLNATIILGQREFGWIVFFSNTPRKFTGFERRIIRGVADLAAAAIERSRLFAEAQAAQKAAEEANRVKSQFLANMSHELRTPLNAVLNFTAFVADGIFGPVNDEQVEALQQAISSGKHLLSLINDVLDLTKIEVGLMDLFIQEVDFNLVLSSTISVAKGLVKDKPIELIANIEKDLPHTFGDKRRIHQIFLNLISNAVKFTPQGSIAISARREGATIYVDVTDTGIGIAPEDQSLVFESFKQANQVLAEAVGTGLGLPISKFFAEAHGGKLWLESQPGTGSTFHVSFPIRTKEEANAANVTVH